MFEPSGSFIVSLNVLLVEDDVFLRSVMAEAISILGLVVTDCQSADQALIALESMEPFSLVITDVRMPGRLDGLDLAQAIWSRWPEVPVIIMSANTVLAPGFLPPNAKFLTKPVHLSSLHGAIAELLPEAD
nr:response regulator [Pseudomonas fluorescens]